MDDYRGKKVLVTGGLGFIGSNVAIRLVELGASVMIVDNLTATGGANSFNIEPVKKDVEVVEGDTCDLPLMRRLVRGCTHVFNLAGHVSHTESMEDPFGDLQMNATGPLTVLEACKKENREARVVYAGTRQSYGKPDALPVVENLVLKPVDVNGVNKMAGEWFHMVYQKAYGIPATSLRLVNTYGPRQLVKHARQGFIGWFIRQAIEGAEIQVYGDGQQFRGFNYIDDVVDALLHAGTHESVVGDYFNLGGMQPVTLEVLVQTLLRATGKGSYKLVPFPEDRKRIDIGSAYSSFMKFHFATGWTPTTSLESGLAQTVAYYQRFRAHYW
jgi:nucleoside-diphosphate-sugar epimerase